MAIVELVRPVARRRRRGVRSVLSLCITTALAGLLGLVGPAQQAEAFALPPLVAPSLPGAVEAIAPEVLGMSNPFGWAVTAAAVGYELFDHRDGIAGFSNDLWNWATGNPNATDEQGSCLDAANRAGCGLPPLPVSPSPAGSTPCTFPVTAGCGYSTPSPTNGQTVARMPGDPAPQTSGYAYSQYFFLSQNASSPFQVYVQIHSTGNSLCFDSEGFDNNNCGTSDVAWHETCVRPDNSIYSLSGNGPPEMSLQGNPTMNDHFSKGVININVCYEYDQTIGNYRMDRLVSYIGHDAGGDANFNNSDPWSWVNGNIPSIVEAITTVTIARTCRDGNGADVVVTGTSDKGSSQAKVPGCPAGTYPVKVDVSTKVGDAPSVPAFSASVPASAAAAYPDCIGVGKGCALRVFDNGQPCSYADIPCRTWKPQVDGGATRFSCSWGPYTLTIDQCAPLAHGYETHSGYVTERPTGLPANAPLPAANPDGSPYRPGTDNPGWTTPGETGSPTPSATPSPTVQPVPTGTGGPSPSGTGSPSPTPTPTGTNVPGPGGAGAPGPGATPDEGDCFPSGWGLFNPVEWVLKPVKCALVWAFVPPPGTLTGSVQGVRDTLASKPPYSLIAPVAAPLVALGHSYGGGCGGSLADFGGGLVIPCSPGGAGWAVTLYVIASGAIVFATAFALWSMLETALHKE